MLDLKAFKSTSASLIRFGLPVTIAMSIGTVASLYTSSLIGHFAPKQFSAYTLGYLVTSMTGNLLLMGISGALETLCSQAVTSGHPELASVVVQQGLVVNSIISIPIIFCWWFFAEPVLLAIGQDPDVSAMAATYIKYCIPQPFIWNASYCLYRYLIAHGKANRLITAQLIAFPVSLGLDWLLIWHLEYGYIGHAWKETLVGALVAVILVVMCWRSSIRKYWKPWSMETSFNLPGWANYFKLGLPSLAMLLSKLWAKQALVLVAGLFGANSLAANQIGGQATMLFVMIAVGLGTATTNLIGFSIGKGDVHAAKQISRTTVILGLVLGTLSGISVLLLKNFWSTIITSDPDIAKIVALIIPVMSLVACFDFIQCMVVGILRGLGLQTVGMICNLISFYVIAPILVCTLMKLDGRVYVVWAAWCIGLISNILLSLGYLKAYNWDKSVKSSEERNQEPVVEEEAGLLGSQNQERAYGTV